MKKSLSLAVLALGLVITSAAWAGNGSSMKAPDRVGKWDLGLSVAAAFNDDADDDAFFSGAVSYGVTPYIGLGVEAGWQEADAQASNDESLGVVPVLFDIILRCPSAHESLVPYGVLGLGVMGAYVTNENGLGANQGDDSDDTGFGWKLGGGVDWFINDSWILNFEFAYWDADVDLPTASFGDGLSFWTLGVGLKYVF